MTFERRHMFGQPHSSQVTTVDPEEFYHVQYKEPRRRWEPLGATERTAEGLPELRKRTAEWAAQTPDWEWRIIRTLVEVV